MVESLYCKLSTVNWTAKRRLFYDCYSEEGILARRKIVRANKRVIGGVLGYFVQNSTLLFGSVRFTDCVQIDRSVMGPTLLRISWGSGRPRVVSGFCFGVQTKTRTLEQNPDGTVRPRKNPNRQVTKE